MEIFGLAVPYLVPTRLAGDQHRTMFARGAFASALRGSAIEARVNHRRYAVIARQGDQTLGFHETTAGLFYWLSVLNRDWAGLLADVAALGQVHGASIAWDPGRARETWVDGVRVIHAAPLLEVSICTFDTRPQFSGTSATFKRDARTV